MLQPPTLQPLEIGVAQRRFCDVLTEPQFDVQPLLGGREQLVFKSSLNGAGGTGTFWKYKKSDVSWTDCVYL